MVFFPFASMSSMIADFNTLAKKDITLMKAGNFSFSDLNGMMFSEKEIYLLEIAKYNKQLRDRVKS